MLNFILSTIMTAMAAWGLIMLALLVYIARDDNKNALAEKESKTDSLSENPSYKCKRGLDHNEIL